MTKTRFNAARELNAKHGYLVEKADGVEIPENILRRIGTAPIALSVNTIGYDPHINLEQVVSKIRAIFGADPQFAVWWGILRSVRLC